ncbi:MAG: two-component system sensor histidine kinase CreC [Pseudomonadota bacterium]
MRLGLRIFFAFFAITGIAAFFVLRVFIAEVKPSVREVMEDLLVDSANLLAEQARDDLRAMSAGGTLYGSRFAEGVADYASRPVDARIWGLEKRSLDFRVYVTDANGRVVFDSGTPAATGADYSRWRDVARTLRGEYGARATREVDGDDRSSVMYVAAPVTDAGKVLGVLTVAKPLATISQFIDRAERKMLVAGLWLLALSLAVGVAATLWLVFSVRKLRRYAQAVGTGERQAVPALPGELGDLAVAVDGMRERLEGRHEVEQAMRAMTHELKSPLAAIGGAAELLHDDLPAPERERFSNLVGEQVVRLRSMVDRLLELSKLEGIAALQTPVRVALLDVVRAAVQEQEAVLAQRHLQVQWIAESDGQVNGDAEQLALAVSNLLGNAVDFAPEGSLLELSVRHRDGMVEVSLRDQGPGVPDYALPQLGQRFFSMPRPHDGRKGSGLGLAIVKRVTFLHGGTVAFTNGSPGLRATLALPMA